MTLVSEAPLARVMRWLRPAPAIQVFLFHYENVLGTSLELRIRATSRCAAEQAEQYALAEIDRLERIFSSFAPDSEFRRWQDRRGVATRLSPELLEVLRSCEHWQTVGQGAFHPASEALTRLWRQAVRDQRLPSAEEIASVRAQIAPPAWTLDRDAQTATCLAECPLSLNAIAKGYIVDRACDAAFTAAEGITGVILNIGGDLRIRSDRVEPAGITDPDNDAENAPLFACVHVQNGALATSGDWRRGFWLGDTLYSHIVDPRTGAPAAQVRSASAVAPTAADADALATIFSILSPEESLALADSLPGVGCLLIAREGAAYRNAHWQSIETPVPTNQ